MTESPDRQVVACNYIRATKSCKDGALCFVRAINESRVQVLARSRSGRLILKWEDIRYLGHFRLKTIPAEHPLYRDDRLQAAFFNPDDLLAQLKIVVMEFA